MSLKEIACPHLTRPLFRVVALALCVTVGPIFAETAVNTYTTGDQALSAVTADGLGRFIVVWVSDDQDGDGTGIFGQRFEADGLPLGEEFVVNNYTTGNQSQPRVAANAGGHFIVVWQGQGQGGSGRDDVFARRFDASGLPIAGQFQVNEGTSQNQRRPAVALADDGAFLTVWSNQDQLAARHFDSSGVPTTGDFAIAVNDVDDPYGNGYGSRSFHRRDAEVLPGGNFVIVWHDHYYPGYGYVYYDTIRAAILDENASQIADRNLSAGFGEQQRAPFLAPDADGGFVVAWAGYTYYAVYSRIYARRFSSTGLPQGGAFDPTPTGKLDLQPRGITAVGSDRFLVVWNDPEIEGRYVATDGTPLSGPFRINTEDVSASDRDPAVISSGRDLMVTWTRDDGSPAMDEVVGSIGFLFHDSFESGDTSAWSETVSP